MPNKNSFKSYPISILKGRVTTTNPPSTLSKNNGAYLRINYFDRTTRRSKNIKIKVLNTKEKQLEKYIGKSISISDLILYVNEFGKFYNCYNINSIKYISKYDLN